MTGYERAIAYLRPKGNSAALNAIVEEGYEGDGVDYNALVDGWEASDKFIQENEEMTMEPFKPHPNLSDEINQNIAESELQGGVFVKDLTIGAVLSVRTQNTVYTVERREDGIYVSGHAKYCPTPTLAHIHGSTWGGSMLKMEFIGRGMRLEFSIPEHSRAIVTSAIEEITEIK